MWVFGAMVATTMAAYQSTFPTAESRANLVRSFEGNPAFEAIFGLTHRMDTVAGYTATTVNVAIHVNGKVEAKSPHPAGFADKAQHGYQVNLAGLAGCKSCHGANLDGAGGTAQSCATCHPSAGFASWATNCTFCHGNRTTGVQSPPVDIQGRTATTNVAVGVHA